MSNIIYHKKPGLAKLAKAHSLSNSLNNLGLELAQEERKIDSLSTKDTQRSPSPDRNSPNTHRKLGLSNSAGSVLSARYIHTKRLGTNEDKMVNDSHSPASSSPVPRERRRSNPPDMGMRRSSPDVRLSTPAKEAYDGGGTFKSYFLHSLNRKSFRKKKSKKETTEPLDNSGGCSLSSSPVQDHLQVPKRVSRSRSLNRLSDAFSQLQNVCLVPSKSGTDSEAKVRHLPAASSTTALMVASDQTSAASSPINAPSPAIRTLKTSLEPSLHLGNTNSPPPRSSRSPLICSLHSNRVVPLNAPSHVSQYKSYPSPPTTSSSGRAPSESVFACRNQSLKRVSYSDSNFSTYSDPKPKLKPSKSKTKKRRPKRGRNHLKESASKSPNARVSNCRTTNVCNSSSSPANPSSRMPLHLDTMAKNRSGKRASCGTLEQIDPYYLGSDYSDDTTDSEYADNEISLDSSRRSSSLSQLSNVAPLSQIKLSEVKHRTYLFGGLGSLLGANELDRYFPDRNIVIFIATWNMNGKEPPDSLDDFLLPDDIDHMPDMYIIGTQESGGDRTEWEVRLQTTIGPSHVLFHSAILGILHLTVFIRRDLVWFCSVPEEAYHSLRPGTYFKTKGAIAISFQIFGTKMIFINTHLFAHEEKLVQRIQNYKNIITNLDVPRNLKKDHMYRSKDVTKRYDIVFWLGDLNFRLVGPRDEILEKIETCSKTGEDLSDLLYFDQLSQSKHKGEIFEDFSEGPISFPPTFKFDVGTSHYDTSSKQRVPSYTDRILYKSKRDPIKCLNYGSCPHFKSSDHKPVWGVFNFKVRPGKDDVPLAAGLFQREVYLAALKRRRRFFHQPSSRNCQMQ